MGLVKYGSSKDDPTRREKPIIENDRDSDSGYESNTWGSSHNYGTTSKANIDLAGYRKNSCLEELPTRSECQATTPQKSGDVDWTASNSSSPTGQSQCEIFVQEYGRDEHTGKTNLIHKVYQQGPNGVRETSRTVVPDESNLVVEEKADAC